MRSDRGTGESTITIPAIASECHLRSGNSPIPIRPDDVDDGGACRRGVAPCHSLGVGPSGREVTLRSGHTLVARSIGNGQSTGMDAIGLCTSGMTSGRHRKLGVLPSLQLRSPEHRTRDLNSLTDMGSTRRTCRRQWWTRPVLRHRQLCADADLKMGASWIIASSPGSLSRYRLSTTPTPSRLFPPHHLASFEYSTVWATGFTPISVARRKPRLGGRRSFTMVGQKQRECRDRSSVCA